MGKKGMNLGYSKLKMDSNYGNITGLQLLDTPQYAPMQHPTTETGLTGQPEKDKQSTRLTG
ncbi:conserved protein of unknown function [Limnospira indica PCC 8005]|uniref:Uncharacterized protein n=1 Tax=Limnospira indica PCC 8005 TaxID=376219 RepID=A0A9P1KDK0_9CYAN|nr:conserved protein of unknown function [Limnospira indica PCC 8005]